LQKKVYGPVGGREETLTGRAGWETGGRKKKRTKSPENVVTRAKAVRKLISRASVTAAILLRRRRKKVKGRKREGTRQTASPASGARKRKKVPGGERAKSKNSSSTQTNQNHQNANSRTAPH